MGMPVVNIWKMRVTMAHRRMLVAANSPKYPQPMNSKLQF